MTTDSAAPAWRRAVRPAQLLLPLLLTLAVIPLAQSGGRPAPAPPAAETIGDLAPAAPAAGSPALGTAQRPPGQVVQPAGPAPQRPVPQRAAPRRTVVRSGPSSAPPPPVPDDTSPDEEDAVEQAVRCVETVTLGTGSC